MRHAREPIVVGVRHHSPACARLVQATVAEVRPRAVLIEGPADMNGRLDELAAEHHLPIAVFSYYQHGARTHASWSPLCDYSPEWVALREARAIGASARFIDLPAWASAFAGVRNRYADGARPTADYVGRLCKRLGVDGLDALWDHLFEQPMPTDELRGRLDAYFHALRAAGGVGAAEEARDEAREAFMAQHIAYAMSEGDGEVVVVCGGYHAPHLAEAWRRADPAPPALPEPEEGARRGSYLVPYSFRRLDSFTGYEAGMPSPAYYQAAFEEGPERAGELMLERAVKRLRQAKQPISAADLIAAETMTRGLMRLRGHQAMARTDLLDGVAAALLKDAQDAPLPWTRRGPLQPGTDPLLVEVLAALQGTREGTLAAGTPRPPLSADVQAQLERHDLAPGAEPRVVRIDLTDRKELARSRALHRLRVLQIPGFARTSGPSSPTEELLEETWSLTREPDAESALVEAAAWGATLESAASARLEELLLQATGDLDVLARVLGEALFVGLPLLARRVLEQVAAQVHLEPHLGRLGSALALLLSLFRHDTLLGAARSAELGTVIAAMVARGLWLFEGVTGPEAPARPEELRAIIALRDTVRHAAAALGVDAGHVREVMERRAGDPAAPPAHRGAAVGYLWSMGAFESEAAARARAVRTLRGAARPHLLGELLAGLFALAREEVVAAGELVAALDELLRDAGWHDLMVALPSLRLAFAWFPPRERDAIARLVLQLHGEADLRASRLRRLDVDAAHIARALELERRVDAIESRYGLAPSQRDEP